MSEKTIQGIAAAGGIAFGPVFRYETRRITAERRPAADPLAERARLDAALAQAGDELDALAAKAREGAGAGEAEIFEAHRLFVEDPELLARVYDNIDKLHLNAEYCWQERTDFYAASLRNIGDEYLAARAADVEDVSQRVLRIMQGVASQAGDLTSPSVIVATDLAPSDTVSFDKANVLAFCTASGGPTSHVAILSKALGIPAVVGLGEGLAELASGIEVIVDGTGGTVVAEPSPETMAGYKRRLSELHALHDVALKAANEPAITRDGKRVEIVSNIGRAEDAAEALQFGAEGVGLLRTEFLFLDRESAPDEDEQYAVYRAALETMGKRPVVVRTLDIGGDKPATYLKMPEEMNPFLGVRGLRLSLANPGVFQTQLRALLRAGHGHNLKIMFPMVAALEEINEARKHVDEARAALEAAGTPYAKDAEVGIMVEVPSAAVIADVLAPAVDFFSIGTNDLSQYTMAADRGNANVVALADALHPAVLRLIRMVIDAAHARGRWVGLCGELAGDPLAAPVLLGLGLDEFSMNARAVPVVKQTIRYFSVDEARGIALKALSLGTALDVRTYLKGVVEGKYER